MTGLGLNSGTSHYRAGIFTVHTASPTWPSSITSAFASAFHILSKPTENSYEYPHYLSPEVTWFPLNRPLSSDLPSYNLKILPELHLPKDHKNYSSISYTCSRVSTQYMVDESLQSLGIRAHLLKTTNIVRAGHISLKLPKISTSIGCSRGHLMEWF